MICRECNSNKIIEDYKGGCMVCTNCGLVAEPYLLDCRPIFDDRRNIHHFSTLFADSNTNYDIEFKNAFEYLRLDSHVILQTTTEIMNSYIEVNNYKGHLQGLRAYATYEACKRSNLMTISKNQICEAFDISEDKMNKFIREIQVDVKNASTEQSPSIRKRIMSLASTILKDTKTKMKVLDHCEELERVLNEQIFYKQKTIKTRLCYILFCSH